MEKKNLELHTVITEIDRQGEELRNAICVERKIIEEHEEILLKVDVEIKEQKLEIQG